MIYSYALTDIENLHIDDSLRITARNIPIVEILLVNKQFSYEYQSIANEKAAITIYNYAITALGPLFKELDVFQPNELPVPARRISRITFDVCCSRFRSAPEELRMLENWTDRLLKQFEFKRVRSIDIDVVVSPAFDVSDFEGQLLWSGNWTSLIRLKSLRIWRNGADMVYGMRVLNAEKLLRNRRTLLMEWEASRARFRCCVSRDELIEYEKPLDSDRGSQQAYL